MGFLISIAIGIAAGYIASRIMKLNYGVLFCLVIGIIGAVIGNFLFGLLTIKIDWPMFTYVGQFITSTVGSIVLLWLYVYFKRKH